VVLLGGLGLAGCASPNPNLYALQPVAPAVAGNGAGHVVSVLHVSIPGYADRPEIVREADTVRVLVDHNDRWASPLDDMAQSVLAEDLQARLPGAVVFADAEPVSAAPTERVEVAITRFSGDGMGRAVLGAQYGIRVGDAPAAGVRRRDVSVAEQVPGAAGFVSAESGALGELADAIAAGIEGHGWAN
jgi:uncharacterized lipoprotein YmbA